MKKFLFLFLPFFALNASEEEITIENYFEINWEGHIWEIRMINHSPNCNCYLDEDHWISPNLKLTFSK